MSGTESFLHVFVSEAMNFAHVPDDVTNLIKSFCGAISELMPWNEHEAAITAYALQKVHLVRRKRKLRSVSGDLYSELCQGSTLWTRSVRHARTWLDHKSQYLYTYNVDPDAKKQIFL